MDCKRLNGLAAVAALIVTFIGEFLLGKNV